MIGFCDCSVSAYAAVLYIRSTNSEGNSDCYFVCAKSRVAPLKSSCNIHRLELDAAVMLTRLLVRVADTLNIDRANVFAFSDS